MLFDTDVLIWYFRGHTAAAEFIRQTSRRLVSPVAQMELYAGARNRTELMLIRSALRDLGLSVVPLSFAIGRRAVALVETLALSHGLAPADALIAATALEIGEPLATGNRKHFASIHGLELRLFQPA